MFSEQTHAAAEKALIEWVDICQEHKLSIPDIVFLLQFRIYDLNRMALRHWEESQALKSTQENAGENNG